MHITKVKFIKKYDPYRKKDAVEARTSIFTLNHVYEILKIGDMPVEKATLTVRIPTHLNGAEIAKVTKIHGLLEGQKLGCKKVTTEDELKSIKVPTVLQKNKFYINCSNSVCQKIRCDVGPFIADESVEKVVFMVDLDLDSATSTLIKIKNKNCSLSVILFHN